MRPLNICFTGQSGPGDVVVAMDASEASTDMEHTDSAGARGRIFKYAVYIAAFINSLACISAFQVIGVWFVICLGGVTSRVCAFDPKFLRGKSTCTNWCSQ